MFTVELSKRDNRKDSGGDALRGNTRTHPNTKVKTEAADDTMLETAWESRWAAGLKKGL